MLNHESFSGRLAIRRAIGVFAVFAGTLPAHAAPVDDLMDLMKFPEVIEVLVDEGRGIGDDMSDDELGVPRFLWQNMINSLYDEEVMTAAFKQELSAAFGTFDLSPIIAFYDSDLGQEIAQLELDARKAVSDEAVLSAAGDLWADLAPDSERAMLIEEYVVTNDLIEMNVVGSLNSDMAYYRGLSEVAGYGVGPSDSDIMREVWASEPDARAHITEWVYGFSTLAYEPLEFAEFDAYIEFGKTEAGQVLNTALFAAFDKVYADLARGLGAGTALLFQTHEGQDL